MRFEVAFSFSGEDRALIEPIVKHIVSELGKKYVLYDKFHEAEFARPDLDIYLPKMFNESRLVVVMLSESYSERKWTGLEWRQIRQAISKRSQESIMFICDKEISEQAIASMGLTAGDGYLRINRKSPESTAQQIMSRLKNNDSQNTQREYLTTEPIIKKSGQRIKLTLSILVLCLLVGVIAYLFHNKNNLVNISFESYRDPVVYHVTLHSKPDSKDDFIVPYESDDYFYYHSEVAYTRFPGWGAKNLLIAAITDISSYYNWVKKSDVVYREIIGVSPIDQQNLRNLEFKINAAKSTEEKVVLLQKLFRISVYINDQQLQLKSFSREPFGFVFEYGNTDNFQSVKGVSYKFICESFQKKTQKMFPFIVSEPFKHLDYKLDYSDTKIDSPEVFSAFLIGPTSDVSVQNDQRSHILTAKSTGENWVLPGGGVALIW